MVPSAFSTTGVCVANKQQNHSWSQDELSPTKQKLRDNEGPGDTLVGRDGAWEDASPGPDLPLGQAAQPRPHTPLPRQDPGRGLRYHSQPSVQGTTASP